MIKSYVLILDRSIIPIENSELIEFFLPADLPTMRMSHDYFVLRKLTEIFLTRFPKVIFLIGLFIFGRLPRQAIRGIPNAEVGTMVRSQSEPHQASTVFPPSRQHFSKTA